MLPSHGLTGFVAIKKATKQIITSSAEAATKTRFTSHPQSAPERLLHQPIAIASVHPNG